MKKPESFIVSAAFTSENAVNILLVGKQENGRLDVVNAFQGEEAAELYRKLTTVRKREEEEKT